MLTADADLEWLLIDSTIVRAHQHAAGARIAKGGLMSRGWATAAARPPAAADALGNPVRLLFGPGQRHEVTRGHDLIEGLNTGAVIADKGYDAEPLHQAIRDAGAEPVIPAKANRTRKRPHDRTLHKERNHVERFFKRLKQFRRVATGSKGVLLTPHGDG